MAVCACLCILAVAQQARADYYKYTDSTGTVCITNNRDEVPTRYRASMKVIRESDLAKREAAVENLATATPLAVNMPVRGTEPAPAAAPVTPAPGGFGQLTESYPWLSPLAVVCGIGIAFAIVVKLASRLPSPQLSRLVYIVFFLGTIVFAYKSYVGYMNDSYSRIKGQVLNMYQKANDREELKTESKPAGD